ncbi:helix-turn-helix transcriptional regulator [Georgenia alba]|uniref:AAA family ATPase n=1 Tax=Georgenia alba TaxID=2233858 RepID=A0ABW2Q8N6_9MICO
MATQTSPTMIGRDTELTELASLLGVTGGTGGRARGAVLLAGDAGVGKTRLLTALGERARQAGWRVVVGHCLDFAESALPYLPFSDVLGRLEADAPELVEDVAASYPAITRLRPGRRTRDQPQPEAAEPDHLDRAELFDAVHHLLDAAARESALLVVVEDLHWADQSTRDLLGYLFTRPLQNPVSIVASYRSDDLHRRHPLRRQVAAWTRLPELDRLALAPLPDAAVRELTAALAPAGLPEHRLADIVARAEGNAFFVEELVASGTDGRGVPEDLVDVLLVRLDGLSDAAREVVRVASVAGRSVSHDLLSAAAGMSPGDLEAGVRQAVEMNLLLADGDRYSFRHALLGEAVYDDLLPSERVRMHAQYVSALTEGAARGSAAELARHARRAADQDRATLADIEAGDEAVTVGAPQEAARHYEHALEALAEPGRAARLGVDHADVVARAADALRATGDVTRAAALVGEELARLPADHPAGSRARLLSLRATLLLMTETDQDFLALSREAAAMAEGAEERYRARVLADHARILTALEGSVGHSPDPQLQEEARRAAAEALTLAERLELPKLASEVATTLGTVAENVRAALEEAVRQAAGADAIDAELRARWLLARSHQDEADWDAAVGWFRSAMERGLAAGLPWAPYSLESRWQLVLVLYARGAWDEALALAALADDERGAAVPRALLEVARLEVLAARGEDVLGRLRALRPLWPEEGGIAVYAAAIEIEAYGRSADAAAATACYDDVVAVLGRIWTDQFAGKVRLAAQTLSALARAVPATSAAERRALAERADGLLADGRLVGERFAALPGRWGVEGAAWERRLVAEHLRVRWLAGVDPPGREELVEAWTSAVAAFETLGHLPELARVRTSYAQTLHLLGDRQAAREQATAARATAEDLGWVVLLEELDASERTDRGPTGRAGGAGSRLTARELEILALLAEGRTNGEIGKQLFIATKTVSVHVSNILGKLGAAGRTEAAAIARRDGLLG